MGVLPYRMYDAIPSIANGIPSDAKVIAVYVDSVHYTWSSALRAKFSNALQLEISTSGSNAGLVGDCENGDMTPAEVVDWVGRRRSAGVNAGVYCNAGTWPSVIDAFDNANVTQPWYWIARYDGDPTLPVLRGITALAKQYNNPPNSGGTYDVSSITSALISIIAVGGKVSTPTPADYALAVWQADPTNPDYVAGGRIGHLISNTNLLIQDLRGPNGLNVLRAQLVALSAAVALMAKQLDADFQLDTGQSGALTNLLAEMAKLNNPGLSPQDKQDIIDGLGAKLQALFGPGWNISITPKTGS